MAETNETPMEKVLRLRSPEDRVVERPGDAVILLALDLRYPSGVAAGDLAEFLHQDVKTVAGCLRRAHALGLVDREEVERDARWWVSQGAHRLMELVENWSTP